MADERLVKRARANTNGDVQAYAHHPQWEKSMNRAVHGLKEHDARGILFLACQLDPRTAQMVLQQYNKDLDVERATVMNFDQHSKDAWYTLNIEYDKLSGSKQYHKAGEAFDSVRGCITTIGNSVSENSSFGTKRSALETLRKIGKSICMSSDDTLGHEVVMQFQYDSVLEDTMRTVVEFMTPDERRVMRAIDDGRGEFIGKMVELRSLSKGYCIFDTLPEVIALLEGKADQSEEVEAEENDDGGDE